jgi:hypothetical protein
MRKPTVVRGNDQPRYQDADGVVATVLVDSEPPMPRIWHWDTFHSVAGEAYRLIHVRWKSVFMSSALVMLSIFRLEQSISIRIRIATR